MHALITGGLGFIGSHLAARFCRDGHRVSLIVRNPDSIPAVDVTGAVIVPLDLLNEEASGKLSLGPIDCLVHLAGPSSAMERLDDPAGILADGRRGTLNALALAERFNASRFLYASSLAVYGEPACNPVSETAPCLPLSQYAIGKLANEHLVESFCRDSGIRFNHLRLAAVYGPGQDLSRTTHGIVNIFLGMLMKGSAVTSKGSLDRFRDLIHIDDAVEACLRCAKVEISDGPLNIGSGESITVERLINVLADEVGIADSLAVDIAEGTPGDVNGITADISKMQALLSFNPQYSPDDGVRRYVRWVIENGSQEQ